MSMDDDRSDEGGDKPSTVITWTEVDPGEEALPAFLTAQYGRSWSERTIEELLASAVGGRRAAPKRAARPPAFAIAGVTLTVAVAAASTSMAYLTSWPEGDAVLAGRLKQDGFAVDAALLNSEPLDMKAVPGQADAVLK